MISGIIVVDKPAGFTSHDVVAKLRGIFKERRIGHGGTLDPMATGVLPVFVGRATRAVDFFAAADKEYVARLRLGIVTDTQDITGSVLSQTEEIPGQQAVLAAAMQFSGDVYQLPPMYSAIKKQGKKLYELARKGIEVEREKRLIHISEIAMTCVDAYEYELRVSCSKGTYVRTLCHDIGQLLGCGAVMTQLRRVRAGIFGLDDAVTLEELEQAEEEGGLKRRLLPVDRLFFEQPALAISGRDEHKCRNGAAFDTAVPDGRYRVYSGDEFLALGQSKSGQMKIIKSFYEVSGS